MRRGFDAPDGLGGYWGCVGGGGRVGVGVGWWGEQVGAERGDGRAARDDLHRWRAGPEGVRMFFVAQSSGKAVVAGTALGRSGGWRGRGGE